MVGRLPKFQTLSIYFVNHKCVLSSTYCNLFFFSATHTNPIRKYALKIVFCLHTRALGGDCAQFNTYIMLYGNEAIMESCSFMNTDVSIPWNE